MNPHEHHILRTALRRLDIRDVPRIADRMDRYVRLLREWNQRVNLISTRDEPKLVGRHILESIGLIGVFSFSPGSRIVDIGTGAGFPGLPVAAVRPDLRMTLVESKRKKILFLQKAVQNMGLDNVVLVRSRIEESGAAIPETDWIVSRAVADLTTLCGWAVPIFGNRSGTVIAFKGIDIKNEVTEMQSAFPDLQPEILPYHPFPDLPDTRESRLIRIRINS